MYKLSPDLRKIFHLFYSVKCNALIYKASHPDRKATISTSKSASYP